MKNETLPLSIPDPSRQRPPAFLAELMLTVVDVKYGESLSFGHIESIRFDFHRSSAPSSVSRIGSWYLERFGLFCYNWRIAPLGGGNSRIRLHDSGIRVAPGPGAMVPCTDWPGTGPCFFHSVGSRTGQEC